MKIYGVAGWKNAGKTGLMERLVAEITARGFSVSTVKHAHHSFEIDHPNTDSYKIRKSGAYKTTIISDKRLAFIEERVNENEIDLNSLMDMNEGCDVIILEGFKKRKEIPKIEVFLKRNKKDHLYKTIENVRLLITDDNENHPLRSLKHDQIPLIANFILNDS